MLKSIMSEKTVVTFLLKIYCRSGTGITKRANFRAYSGLLKSEAVLWLEKWASFLKGIISPNNGWEWTTNFSPVTSDTQTGTIATFSPELVRCRVVDGISVCSPILFFPSFLDWGAVSTGTDRVVRGSSLLIVISFFLLFFVVDCPEVADGTWSAETATAALVAAYFSLSAAAFWAASSLFCSWMSSSIVTIFCCSGHNTRKKESKSVTV